MEEWNYRDTRPSKTKIHKIVQTKIEWCDITRSHEDAVDTFAPLPVLPSPEIQFELSVYVKRVEQVQDAQSMQTFVALIHGEHLRRS